jgi:hypothetical protein
VAAETNHVGYCVWAADNAVYAPVELPALIAWIKDQRVLADTWIFEGTNDHWRKAANLPELQIFFRKKSANPIGGDAGLFRPQLPGWHFTQTAQKGTLGRGLQPLLL